MQSPLFGYTEPAVPGPLQPAEPADAARRPRPATTTSSPARARMVAYQGLLEFDGEYQSTASGGPVRSTGEGLDLMRCSGQGTVYLANLAQHVHVVDVDQDGLTVDSAYVLALDSTLHYEVIAVDSQYGISGSGQVPAQHLRPGQGRPDDLRPAADDAGHARQVRQRGRRRDRRLVERRCACRCRRRRTPRAYGGGAATPARAGSSASWARATRSSSPASCCRRRTPRSARALRAQYGMGQQGAPRTEPGQRLELHQLTSKGRPRRPRPGPVQIDSDHSSWTRARVRSSQPYDRLVGHVRHLVVARTSAGPATRR